MSRRRIIEEPVNHERWLVSYADFITLLFAFFVVMYSISQVNEGKYKVLSDTLTDAFGRNKSVAVERSLKPIQIGDVAQSNPLNFIDLNAEGSQVVDAEDSGMNSAGDTDLNTAKPSSSMPAEFERINEQLDQAFSDLLTQGLITIRGNEEWLEIELKSSLLFSSGDSLLSIPALEILGDIAAILKQHDSPVRVEGFTDSVPIKTAQFPSNWELSSSRAAAVVQLFIEEGMAPGRLAAIGYGEFQPVADNMTEEGRAANRRVVLMISKTGQLRPLLPQVGPIAEAVIESAVTPSQIVGPDKTVAPSESAVNDHDAAAKQDDQLTEPNDLNGVKTIRMNDGGLLFTNDTPTEGNQ